MSKLSIFSNKKYYKTSISSNFDKYYWTYEVQYLIANQEINYSYIK